MTNVNITLYGAADCEDTAHVRERPTQLGVPFQEVDIDRDPAAAQFVTFVNGGQRSTPTLPIGSGHVRTIATEPSDDELDAVLAGTGLP